MKLKNILIVVKDIEASKKFYHDLFGIDMVLDNDGNMILTEGLVLQDEKIWKSFLDRDIVPKNNSCELYFEEQDIESFIEKLE
ncbi:MAG: VOC family protein, partial [Peptococcaceae bacterium]|nr:VOC family protein [Peptococcaceae bacterium]